MLQSLSHILLEKFTAAFAQLGLNGEVMLVEAAREEFGDYQVNGIMKIAKDLKINPRELALKVVNTVDLNAIATKLEVAGPGFINITIHDDFLTTYVSSLNHDNRFGASYLKHHPESVVVDMSSPNLAKEMHVGHLRSTIIGDAIARMATYLGDQVICQNHVGDWGTQFGMLIAYLAQNHSEDLNSVTHTLADLEKFYREAKTLFDKDPKFAEIARQYVVILQNHLAITNGQTNFAGFSNLSSKIQKECQEEGLAAKVFKLWQLFRKISLTHCQIVYDQLEVNLNSSDSCARGESWYNDRLNQTVDKLKQANILIESDGAKCVFFDQEEIGSNEESPFIIQKKDGGFLYATTDLAAIDYRCNEIPFNNTRGANRLIYVVDARQSLHFKQLFVTARKAHLVNPQIKLEHASFGTMMNENGQPFKTRDGGVVKLVDLITTAKERSLAIVKQRNPEWTHTDQHTLAEKLAIAAIKYADLAKNRTSDYIFSFDKMLAFDGNTAPYLLYAYTRIQSIITKAAILNIKADSKIIITNPSEHAISLHIARFADTLNIAVGLSFPHYITQYLYKLAGLFMQFYESSPIIKADSTDIATKRLALATLTADILKTGLEELLGINVVTKM